jgi:hypothetical protein
MFLSYTGLKDVAPDESSKEHFSALGLTTCDAFIALPSRHFPSSVMEYIMPTRTVTIRVKNVETKV